MTESLGQIGANFFPCMLWLHPVLVSAQWVERQLLLSELSQGLHSFPLGLVTQDVAQEV